MGVQQPHDLAPDDAAAEQRNPQAAVLTPPSNLRAGLVKRRR